MSVIAQIVNENEQRQYGNQLKFTHHAGKTELAYELELRLDIHSSTQVPHPGLTINDIPHDQRSLSGSLALIFFHRKKNDQHFYNLLFACEVRCFGVLRIKPLNLFAVVDLGKEKGFLKIFLDFRRGDRIAINIRSCQFILYPFKLSFFLFTFCEPGEYSFENITGAKCLNCVA